MIAINAPAFWAIISVVFIIGFCLFSLLGINDLKPRLTQTPVQSAPSEESIRADAAKIWERIEQFSESMLGDGPCGVFELVKNSEPTKTMLAREKAFAIDQITEYLRVPLADLNRYREALTIIARDCDMGEHTEIARVALDGKESGS